MHCWQSIRASMLGDSLFYGRGGNIHSYNIAPPSLPHFLRSKSCHWKQRDTYSPILQPTTYHTIPYCTHTNTHAWCIYTHTRILHADTKPWSLCETYSISCTSSGTCKCTTCEKRHTYCTVLHIHFSQTKCICGLALILAHPHPHMLSSLHAPSGLCSAVERRAFGSGNEVLCWAVHALPGYHQHHTLRAPADRTGLVI